ncbi:shikimate kinase [Oscillospiraceae bacterium LTW-04]|nr:shikimate kinase [Oscillospiraceae bacterium MB24-C1]
MANTERYGLIGETLGHSYSKHIHHALCGYDYELMSIPRDKIEAFLSARQFAGLNVTIPYKRTVIPHCDLLTDAAREIGSVNTLMMQSDGRLLGDNTDYAGFLYLARKVGISFKNKKVLILGNGGTSLTARTAIRHEGAREIIVVSRNGAVNYQNVYGQADAEIIVNTTPVGMFPNNGVRLIELTRFPKLGGVLDVIYNPLSTALLLEAKRLGIPCGGGLSMLVAQAKYAAERFGRMPISDRQIGVIEQKLRKELTNLVLVGMPGSGKSTLAAACAESMGREVVEIDDIIVQKAGRSIPEIFAKYGEARFREIESETVAEVGRRTGLVISTGGGAILREQNVAALQQNGLIACLDRPLELLPTDGRPLSKGIDALRAMKKQRTPIYKKSSDFTVENKQGIEQAKERIMEGFYEALSH